MKTWSRVGIVSIVCLAFFAGELFAADENPNGFPSGPHFNLNIIGKKDAFICPPPEIVDQIQIYGNVIFVPENGNDINILMESGAKGPKNAQTITELQVTDWCSGFGINDSATLRLPKNENGYRVYARALAKPTYDPTMEINPELVYTQDEFGTDLIFLATLGFNYFETSYGMNTVFRSKGKSIAVNITPIFEWSGDVCYLDVAQVPAPLVELYPSKTICAADTDAVLGYDTFAPFDGVSCPAGYDQITANCATYESKWVFNIADFVGYLWDVDNNGLKLLQVRFYPN